MIKLPENVLAVHKQIDSFSCVPMSVEFVLKLEKQMDINSFELQAERAKYGNSDWVDNFQYGHIVFFRPAEFHIARSDSFPFNRLHEQIVKELSEGKYVIIALSVVGGFHNYVIHDYNRANGEFSAITKPQEVITDVWRRVKEMKGTDIIIYKKKMIEIDNKREYRQLTQNLTAQQMSARLDKILDIRKFEIELYWKRATYFWSFIAAAFTAYGVTLGKMDAMPFNFIAICIGFVFSIAFYLVNKASKFWQENWEEHTDYSEEDVIGKLYSVTFPKSKTKDLFNPIKRYSASVSRINMLLSLFVFIIWAILYLEFIIKHLYFTTHWAQIDIFYSAICAFTLLFSVMLLTLTKSNLPNSDSNMAARNV